MGRKYKKINWSYIISKYYLSFFLVFFLPFKVMGNYNILSPLPSLSHKVCWTRYDEGKKAWFYVVKVEEFEKFYILHLECDGKLHKSLCPKSRKKRCKQIKLNERYYFSLLPMLKNCTHELLMAHPIFTNVEYYDKIIVLEDSKDYARNTYEVKKPRRGVCVISVY